MTTEQLIKLNAYNDALLDILTYVIDVKDYDTRKKILQLWKDGEKEPQKVKVTIHDQVTV